MAFVPGRLIQDNYIVATEVFNGMNHKRSKGGWMAIKADIEKAYDRVEWSFILLILQQFGFHPIWVNWISQCISSSSFSVLLNGSPFGRFTLYRGLQQGDPLLLLLFLLCSEILSRLLLRAEAEGHIRGIKIRRRAPVISHLLFADDLILFAKAQLRDAQSIDSCLEKYMGVVQTKD